MILLYQMDRNGPFTSNINQSRPTWNIGWSNTRTKTRQLSTAKSKQSTYPGTICKGRTKCLSDPITRHSKNRIGNSSHISKQPSTLKNSAFHPAAGVTTVDQTLRLSRLPWIGNSFLSNSCFGKKSPVKKTFDTKKQKTESCSRSYGIFSGKSTIDMDETDDYLSSIDTSQQSTYTDDYEKVIGKQSAKKKVVLLTDHSLKRMRETSNIYLQKNSAYHKQRIRKIETNIGCKHRAQIDRQLTEVESTQKERYRKNIQNMKELSNVRAKFWKEKKKRVRTTYVSVAALEMPEVDRYAYGLPADGKEYTFSKSRPCKSKLNITEKWKESMQKAKSIVKVLALRDKVERTMTLPILKPLTSHAKRKKDVNNLEDLEARKSNDINNNEQQKSEDEKEAKIEDFDETGLSAAKALLEITSELSSLYDTTTDVETDFEDF